MRGFNVIGKRMSGTELWTKGVEVETFSKYGLQQILHYPEHRVLVVEILL